MKMKRTLLTVAMISAMVSGSAIAGIFGGGASASGNTLEVTKTGFDAGSSVISGSSVSGNAVRGYAVSGAGNLSTATATPRRATGTSVSFGGGVSKGGGNAGYSAGGEAAAYSNYSRFNKLETYREFSGGFGGLSW